MAEPRWRRYARFWKRNVVADIDDELRFHFSERVAEYRSEGMTREAALAAARAQFGDAEAVRADLVVIDRRVARQQDFSIGISSLGNDLTSSLRSVARRPAFAVSVVVTFALGLGVNAAMFSFLDRVFVRMPAGVQRPSQLRRLWSIESDRKGNVDVSTLGVGVESYRALAAALKGDADVVAYAIQGAVRFADDDNANHRIVGASAEYLPLLRGQRAARPILRSAGGHIRIASAGRRDLGCTVARPLWR